MLRDDQVADRSAVDVLLITVDTLRADAVGAYGNHRGATPVIDRLAAAGVRFGAAHAHNVVTLASHANILSGKYPMDHGIRDNAGFRFPQNIETLATILKAHGYRTGAFVSAFPLASRFGLNRGFDVYDDSFVDTQMRPVFLEQERAGPETVAHAMQWLGGAGHPYFCWIHLYEPHFPYNPPEPFKSRFRDSPYLGDVATADAALAPLVDPIVAQRRNGRTLIVVTADHGESLGEHEEATHGIFAYESTLHVPLIVYEPARFSARVVSAPAGHVDLLPTILDALSIRVPGDLRGRSLLSVLDGGPPPSADVTYFEALSGSLNRGWAPLSGVIRNRLKFVDLPVPELYDLDADPGERHNLAESQRDRLAEMRAALSSFAAGNHENPRRGETSEARERLRSLGYITTAANPASTAYTAADDPKHLIRLDAMLHDVARLYLAGDLPAALARCRDLVSQRPTMVVSLMELAHLERANGSMPKAIDALRGAVAVNPEEPQAVSLLVAYLTQAGRPREAVEVVTPYLARPDADVQILVSGALALTSAGRHADALSALMKARSQEPGNAMLLVETGTVLLGSGDRDRARQEFDAALRLNPNVARAHTSLAVMAAEDGRHDQAIAHWRQAIALDPGELDHLLSFAEYLVRRGRSADARPYLDLVLSSASPDQDARIVERARGLLR